MRKMNILGQAVADTPRCKMLENIGRSKEGDAIVHLPSSTRRMSSTPGTTGAASGYGEIDSAATVGSLLSQRSAPSSSRDAEAAGGGVGGGVGGEVDAEQLAAAVTAALAEPCVAGAIAGAVAAQLERTGVVCRAEAVDELRRDVRELRDAVDAAAAEQQSFHQQTLRHSQHGQVRNENVTSGLLPATTQPRNHARVIVARSTVRFGNGVSHRREDCPPVPLTSSNSRLLHGQRKMAHRGVEIGAASPKPKRRTLTDGALLRPVKTAPSARAAGGLGSALIVPLAKTSGNNSPPGSAIIVPQRASPGPASPTLPRPRAAIG